MIARTVVDVLTRGIEELQREPDRFAAHLSFLGFGSTYVAGWRTFFVSKKPAVELDYPTKSSPFPLLSVISSGTRDKLHFVGGALDAADEAWGLEPGDVLYGKGVLGSIDETTVRVVAWAKNTETAFQLSLLARWLITRDRDQLLLSLGPVETQEAEIQINEERLPQDGQFARMLTVQVTAMHAQIDDVQPIGPPGSRRLTGLHIDAGTGVNESEGVRANVTTVVHDES